MSPFYKRGRGRVRYGLELWQQLPAAAGDIGGEGGSRKLDSEIVKENQNWNLVTRISPDWQLEVSQKSANKNCVSKDNSVG